MKSGTLLSPLGLTQVAESSLCPEESRIPHGIPSKSDGSHQAKGGKHFAPMTFVEDGQYDGQSLPVVFPGTRLRIRWPLTDGTDGSFLATIAEVRKTSSGFRYLLRWEDRTAPLWSRLRHSTYTVEPHAKAPTWSPDCQEADHAETPLIAYRHIALLLERVAQSMGIRASRLRIYDPYYCAASVRLHLASLGFFNVYNQPENFYASIAEGSVPEFDVLVTNPPYSADHVDRLFEFVRVRLGTWHDSAAYDRLRWRTTCKHGAWRSTCRLHATRSTCHAFTQGIKQPSFLLIPNYFLETAGFGRQRL
jgi:hypothetical protein